MQGKFLVVFFHRHTFAPMVVLCDDGWKTSGGTPKIHPWDMYIRLEGEGIFPRDYREPEIVREAREKARRRALAQFRALREDGALYKRLEKKKLIPSYASDYDVIPLSEIFS